MAAAKPKKDITNPGVFDVSRPGKSAPTATGKPIIVTNRPMLQDPMVVEDQPKEAASPAKAKVTIQPITITSDEDANAGEAVKVTKAEPSEVAPPKPDEAPAPTPELEQPPVPEVAEKPSEASAAAPEAEPKEEPVKPTHEPIDEQAAEPADDSTQKPMTPEEQDAAAKKAEEEEAEHEAAINKLVESQQYFLPINSVENRKTKRFVALGVILIFVLGIAWVDIALDAGLIHVGGLKAVTHFFTN